MKKLNKIVKDQEHTKPFEFHNQGSLAYLGDWCVVIKPKQTFSSNPSDEIATGKPSMIAPRPRLVSKRRSQAG